MAAAPHTVPALQSLEEYLLTSYNPDCDFVDGHIEERNMGELEHSTVQIAVGAWFFNHRADWRIRVASEYRTRVSEFRVRIPDVSVFFHSDPAEKVRTTPPLIAIEILSPDDRMNRVIKRLEDFLAMGVQNVWLLDPMERVAYTLTVEGLRLVDGARISVPDSPIYIDLPEVFSALD